MPIYDYACKRCEHRFDVLQKISDPKLVDCPECGEPSLKKMLSAPKFRLKGKGWYETDFKTGDQRNLAGESDKKSAKTPLETEKKAKKPEASKKEMNTKVESA
ncbi:MAG: zinc ribbon domain-containing protein [Woeseiaceae bacterium]|jgi:putative FmdB family regulatory protein|nr:zinc ribbon domain-containing protein [Woeseiaceae bacterium]